MPFDDAMLDTAKWKGAVCADSKYNPDIWFNQHDEQEAKTICKTCPLLITCAQYAIEAEEPYGVWGGLNPTDRRALTKRRWR